MLIAFLYSTWRIRESFLSPPCSRAREKYLYLFSHTVLHILQDVPGWRNSGLHAHCPTPIVWHQLSNPHCARQGWGYHMRDKPWGGDALLFLSLIPRWVKIFDFPVWGVHPIWMEKLSLWNKRVKTLKKSILRSWYLFMCHHVFQPKTFFLARRKAALRRNHFPSVSGSIINLCD